MNSVNLLLSSKSKFNFIALICFKFNSGFALSISINF